MRGDLAELLAAAAGDDLQVDRAKAVIEEYRRRLAECSVCDGLGTFHYRENLTGPHGNFVPAGTDGPCPNCYGKKYDPTFVAWHCERDSNQEDCQSAQQDGNGTRHAACGLRVMLPLLQG